MVSLEERVRPSISTAATAKVYDITWDVDLESQIISAYGDITFDIKGDGVQVFKLHALDLNIDRNSVSWTSKSSPDVVQHLKQDIIYDKAEQTVSLGPFNNGPSLLKGEGTLHLKWNFMLTDNLCGFYRSKYTDMDGTEKIMAVTQFEATDARRAFPCVDEPAAKAIFNVTLIIPSDRVAISNMPVNKKNTILNGKRVVYTFDPTPVMSTYLLALIVAEFDCISILTENQVRTSVYTPKGKTHLGEHAMYVASKALPFFEDMFKIKYPLAKSDLLAIPDFAAGAMENWGCVTYRETRLLIDKDNSPLANKIACSRTVAHELAHMWFGNLVTMEWWTDLWLNEGFARFMEFLAVDHIFPNWNVWDLFVYAVHGLALDLDAMESSHPIEVPVSHPDEINEIFDGISYAKGASVIRMLYDFIGQDYFMEGVRNYLNKFSYGNAKTNDLWNEINQVVQEKNFRYNFLTVDRDDQNVNINTMMSSWTKIQGYPVVFIEETHLGNTEMGRRTFKLTQALFGDVDSTMVKENRTLWQIPINVLNGGFVSNYETTSPLSVYYMEKESMEVEIPASAHDQFIRFNAGQRGVYRCCYRQRSAAFNQLCDAVLSSGSDDAGASNFGPPALESVDRIGLLSDAFACFKFGLVETPDICFHLASCYKNENALDVLKELSSNLSGMLSVYSDIEEIAAPIRQLIINLFARHGSELGWNKRENESETDAVKRATVMRILIRAKSEEIINGAISLFKNRNSAKIEPDLRGLIYKTAMVNGDIEVYDTLKKIYETTGLADEKRRAFTALASSNESILQQKTLNWALLSGEVRNQDVPTIISSVSNSKNGGAVCWDFFKTNFQAINANFSEGQSFLLGRLVSSCISNLKSLDHVNDVESFFDANPVPSAARRVKESLEKIRMIARRRKREMEPLKAYFTKK
eukprot:g7592.t1